MAENATPKPRQSIFAMITKRMDIALAVAAIAVVLMLIIPLPTFLLDVLLVINLSVSLMILLSTFYVKKPADFSSFPGVILITTIFGLALNVSSTRLILTLGPTFDSRIITAFGNFVVGGNYVVGLIVFVVLLAIQFLVITKGASRVSEVAARFSLDSLPGKQLAIDQDLSAGLINEEEAKKRRADVRLESDFYGAMDGSSKFVSGNVKVALVIVLVDIIGGLIVGLAMGQVATLDEAARTYILFTVGDGLISQIPALLISTATGLIVTRSAAREDFAKDIISQIGSSPRVMYIAGIAILGLGFLPGFPILIHIIIGGLLFGLGFMMNTSIREGEKKKHDAAQIKPEGEAAMTIEDIVKIDPMTLEIGYNLVPLVDKEQGGDLLDRIKLIRKRIGLDLGILVPPIRIIDNVSIDASEYLIKIRGTEIARGKIMINRFLAMNPKLDLAQLDGIEIKEPAFGLPAKWIAEPERQKAESQGFDIFDPPSVVATHLTELIKRNASEILTRQDVQAMFDALRKEYPSVVDEVLKIPGAVGELQKILQNLLREGVRIRNMLVILETFADYAGTVKNIDMLTEFIRQALGKQITTNFVDETSGSIRGIILDPELEQLLSDSIHEKPEGLVSTLDPSILHSFVDEAGTVIEECLQRGIQPVILASQKIRRLVREMLERSFPSIPVLSYSEIPSKVSLDQVGIIRLKMMAEV